MYKFRIYIYLIRVPFCVCQKFYGFKNLVKFGGGETNFKITLGTCVFKNHAHLPKSPFVGAVFDKFCGYFYSKSTSCERAEPTKPNQA